MSKDELFKKIMIDDIDVPGMPDIAVKVLSLLDDDYCSMRKLEKVIFEDQALTTTILKVANAPFYKSGKSINTLAEAIMSIGLHNLLALVSIVSLTNQISGKNFDKGLLDHTMAVSSASALLAQHTRGARKEEALVAGLLHDIGKTILSANAPDHYKSIKSRAAKEKRPFTELEDEVLGFNHCTIGSVLAKKWKFPKIYEFVIRNHHNEAVKNPARLQDIITTEDALCYIVRLADKAVLDAGIGVETSSYEKKQVELMRALDITAETYKEVVKDISAVQKRK